MPSGDANAAEVGGTFLQMTDLGFRFGGRPADAPVVWLNGPLAVHPWFPQGPSPLARGDKPTPLLIRVGTSGVGESGAAWVNPFKGIPGDVHPTADVEFPNNKAGGRPTRVRVPLTGRGGGNSQFVAPLPVPGSSGPGKAKVTVSFPGWKVRPVAPATFDMAIGEPTVGVEP